MNFPGDRLAKVFYGDDGCIIGEEYVTREGRVVLHGFRTQEDKDENDAKVDSENSKHSVNSRRKRAENKIRKSICRGVNKRKKLI